jgi:hypothetical protein
MTLIVLKVHFIQSLLPASSLFFFKTEKGGLLHGLGYAVGGGLSSAIFGV